MEKDKVLKEIEEVLQGETSTGGDRQEKEKEDSGPPRNRARFSGAARRRYRKNLEKDSGRAEKAQATPSSSSGTVGEQNGDGAKKRPAPEHTTPSPKNDRPDKRPKVDRGTCAQVAKNLVRLALVPESYPDRKLSTEEVASAKRLIKGLILSLPVGVKAPTFEGVWERDGAVIFGCTDEETGNWLKSLFPENKIGETTLRVLPIEELPKRHRVVVHVEDPEVSAEESLRFLERQNAGLTASEWVVVRGSESRDAKSAHFAALVGDRIVTKGLNAIVIPQLSSGDLTVIQLKIALDENQHMDLLVGSAYMPYDSMNHRHKRKSRGWWIMLKVRD